VNACLPKKQAILLCRTPLASHFDPRSCGEKTTSAVKVAIAQILPFIALITPALAARTQTGINATNQQPFIRNHLKFLDVQVSNR
jgi:hypothetical protein